MATPAAGRALRILLGGRVQGVGFRPFVYRSAVRFGIAGWVGNEGPRVLIRAQGDDQALNAVIRPLLHEPPRWPGPSLKAESPSRPNPSRDSLSGRAARQRRV